jgi:lysine-specific demethylase 8
VNADATGTPEVLRVHRPSPERFRRDFSARGRPVVLTGVASGWPAVSRWTPSFFRDRIGDAPVRVVERDAAPRTGSVLERALERRRVETRMRDFVDGMQADDGVTRYLIVSPLLTRRPDLAGDVEPLDRYQFPAWVPRRLRRAFQQPAFFWMGPASLASPLHVETVNNLFVQIHGRKDWLLFPPEQSGCLHFPCDEHPDDLLHWSPVDPERPDLERFPRYREARPLRARLDPGDILYVPAGWWHAVFYPETTISLSHFWYGPWSSTVGCRRIHAERLRRKLAAADAQHPARGAARP